MVGPRAGERGSQQLRRRHRDHRQGRDFVWNGTSRHVRRRAGSVRPVPGFRNAQRAGFACIDRTVRPCAVRSGAARCQRGAPACLVCIACFARILALLAPLKRCSPVLGNSFHPLNETSMKFFEGPRELINSLFFSGGNILLTDFINLIN